MTYFVNENYVEISIPLPFLGFSDSPELFHQYVECHDADVRAYVSIKFDDRDIRIFARTPIGASRFSSMVRRHLDYVERMTQGMEEEPFKNATLYDHRSYFILPFLSHLQ